MLADRQTALILPQEIEAFDEFAGALWRWWPPICFPETFATQNLQMTRHDIAICSVNQNIYGFPTHTNEIALISQGDFRKTFRFGRRCFLERDILVRYSLIGVIVGWCGGRGGGCGARAGVAASGAAAFAAF